MDAYFQELTHLSTFIQYLQLYGLSTINIRFTQASIPATYTCEATKIAEKLYFSDEVTRVKEAGALLETARTCSHAGDYYSAINLLVALKDAPITDKWLETEVYLHLALCYRLIEKSIQSEFYYNLCVTSGNFRQKNSALYALSMIYLRHHTSKHLDTSRGTQYLKKAYQLLLKEPDSERIQVDRVFNRNALALVLFKKGDIEGAQRLVEQGIKLLNHTDTRYSKSHQTVLYYNYFQCLVAKKLRRSGQEHEALDSFRP